MLPSNKSIQTYELDVNVSAKTKAETLKFLAVILKNLMEKGADDPKYRQVRLSNPKIHRLTTHASILSYLQQVGNFARVHEDGEALLRCAVVPNATQLKTALAEVEAAKNRVEIMIGGLDNASSNGPLSEKQKARILREEAEEAQKAADKRARMNTVAQIAADKHVRENDPNWKPSVAAAAAKAGDSMQTFRDKFGES
jgi:hypothetical protein